MYVVAYLQLGRGFSFHPLDLKALKSNPVCGNLKLPIPGRAPRQLDDVSGTLYSLVHLYRAITTVVAPPRGTETMAADGRALEERTASIRVRTPGAVH